MEDKKAFPNRKWVIKAGIIFLVIMGLLTFFSNTIMNYSLPQVTPAYPGPASISATIKGSGPIEANKQEKIIADSARTVDTVAVQVGDEVEVGTVLATLIPVAETDEMKQALKELADLKKSYDKDQLGKNNNIDYTAEERAIADAQKALNEANNTLGLAQGKAAAVDAAQGAVNTAQAAVNAAQPDVDKLTGEVGELEAAKTSQQTVVDQAQITYNELYANGEDTTNAKAILTQAKKDLKTIETSLTKKQKEQAKAQGILDQANGELAAANSSLEAAQALPDLGEATDAVTMAQRNLDDANKALSDKKKENGIAQEIESRDNADALAAIAEAQKKVDELSALAQKSNIVAPKAGRIYSLDLTDGVEFAKDQELAVIDLKEANYKVVIPFTVAQAKQMKVGQKARIEEPWTTEGEAIITTIKVDPKDPGNSKLVTFSLEGEFYPGQSASLSLVNQTKQFECVVPNSAIKEDGESGKCVYVLQEKSSPLGTRYIALKVPVTILATDGANSAVDPGVIAGRSVITMSNKPLEDGKQVRLAYS